MAADTPVEIICSGFALDRPSLDQQEMNDVAAELASDIGSRLADLAFSSKHGEVIIRYGGMEGMSGDAR